MRPFFLVRLAVGLTVSLSPLASLIASPRSPADALPPIVFVARAHLATPDFIFGDELGPAGQFGTGLPKFAPGSRLVKRSADGSLFAYSTPGLIDVQSPDVSFDAATIVFAGAKTIDPESTDFGWRLYQIDVDGTDFITLTTSNRSITVPNAAQFGNQETYEHYDDLFPAYLADGRIAFVSSRYPIRSHYDERRSFNLYLMNADGANLHRVSSERGGLLHPTPLPDGRILVARWWNQFNQPSDQGIYNRIDDADTDVLLPDGTIVTANPDAQFNPATGILPAGYPIRDAPNTWHLMVINPDGTGFKRFAWTPRYDYNLTDDSGIFDTYAAAQPAIVISNTQLYVAYTSQQDSTMVHTTLETGIRVARPGVSLMYSNTVDAIAGLTYDKAWGQGDSSGPYALHPWGLADGRILYSQSSVDDLLPASGSYAGFTLQGSNLRYQLYVMNLDGSGKTPVSINLSSIGLATHDVMDAKPIAARVGWVALPDTFTSVPSDDPVNGNVPNTLPEYAWSLKSASQILTATIHNPNVYANASLLSPFVNNSPPPGSVAKAQVWIDANQFTGAYCYEPWMNCAGYKNDGEVRAVLWTEAPVDARGAFTATVPADTPGFIVLRDANGRVVRNWNRGYISIAQGSAWARPGQTVTCVGCHMSHVSGSLDDVITSTLSGWTNVAPYATVAASSYYDTGDPDYQPFTPQHVSDRRGWVPKPGGGPGGTYQDEETGWISDPGQAFGEWIDLTWPIPITATSVRLAGVPPSGGDWGGFGQPSSSGDYHIESGTLRLYLDGAQVGGDVAVGRVEPLANGGTLITLASPTRVDRLRFAVAAISGEFWYDPVAALNEIEVTGMAAEPWPLLTIWKSFLAVMRK